MPSDKPLKIPCECPKCSHDFRRAVTRADLDAHKCAVSCPSCGHGFTVKLLVPDVGKVVAKEFDKRLTKVFGKLLKKR